MSRTSTISLYMLIGALVGAVTHSHLAAAYGDRIVTLRDGQIVDETVNRPPKPTSQLRPVS